MSGTPVAGQSASKSGKGKRKRWRSCRKRESPFNEGVDTRQRVPDTIVTRGSTALRTFPLGTCTISNYRGRRVYSRVKIIWTLMATCPFANRSGKTSAVSAFFSVSETDTWLVFTDKGPTEHPRQGRVHDTLGAASWFCPDCSRRTLAVTEPSESADTRKTCKIKDKVLRKLRQRVGSVYLANGYRSTSKRWDKSMEDLWRELWRTCPSVLSRPSGALTKHTAQKLATSQEQNTEYILLLRGNGGCRD